MTPERLARQIAFIVEIDKLKNIQRRTLLMDGRRYENDAEHSWHIAVMAFLLAEHANTRVDVARVIRMLLVHDLVEIDAGDTYCYDEAGATTKAEREERAAERIFNILPADQASEIRALWDEFERMETPEARFAAALDRLQPMLHNHLTQGTVWKANGITREQVMDRNHHIGNGSQALWEYTVDMIRDAVDKGYLAEKTGRAATD